MSSGSPNRTPTLPELADRIHQLTQLVKAIKEVMVQESDNSTFLRALVGKHVRLTLAHSERQISGRLKWHDKFTVCLIEKENKERMFFKGQLLSIELD